MVVTIHTEIEPPEHRPCPPLPLDGPLLLEYDPNCMSLESQHASGSVALSSAQFPSLPVSAVCLPVSDLPLVSPMRTSSWEQSSILSPEHYCRPDFNSSCEATASGAPLQASTMVLSSFLS
ncbi:hypothetical protein C8J57DRAFT_1526444 [Mycena rebaudengoi]|nr:hypothetical protein C8J57DRAFT_1526444 [Mycena rebaudengoi]